MEIPVQMDTYIKSFYPESAFGGFTDIDGTVVFYARVNALIQPSSVVVDFGCGRGSHSEDPIVFRRNLRCLRGKVARVIGLDVDNAAARNPTIDEFHLIGPKETWPLEGGSCDVVVCDYVIEHLAQPETLFAEAKRVLRNGGYLCVRTANSLSYVGLISRVMPNRYHKSVLEKAQSARKEQDVFPTVYRCNTIPRLRRQMNKYGFFSVVYGYEAEPRYLNFSKIAYGVGVLHQRLAPSFFGPSVFAFGESV